MTDQPSTQPDAAAEQAEARYRDTRTHILVALHEHCSFPHVGAAADAVTALVKPQLEAVYAAGLRTAAELEQLAFAVAPTEVWYWSDDDEGSSPEVYLDVETAKADAITAIVAIDPGWYPEPAFTWRGYVPTNRDTTRWLLDYEGKFTGWSVDRIPVAASVAKAGA